MKRAFCESCESANSQPDPYVRIFSCSNRIPEMNSYTLKIDYT